MLRRAELFEHQTTRLGERLRTIDGSNVVLSDAELAALDRFNNAHGKRFFRVGRREFATTQYVGYVQVGDLAIEILPKADRGTARWDSRPWRAGLFEMLRVVSGLRLEATPASPQSVVHSTLADAVAFRFAEETERLLHGGLAKGYREVEENGVTLRGRLLFAEHIRENLAHADRIFVRHSTYDRDVAVNRILRLALETLARFALSAGTASRVAGCAAQFPDVGRLRVTPDLFDRLHLGRTTERYRSALVLARMILEQTTPALRAGRVQVFALLFDMNTLWERYVATLFTRAAPKSFGVSTQERHAFWKPAARRARTVRPDIVVRRRADRTVALVVDTKWKVAANGVPSDDDLRQMFVYNELLGAKASLLVYPGVKDAIALGGVYDAREHTCATAHLGLFDDAGWKGERLRADVARLLHEIDPDSAS